jgi:hypothetical protein
MTASTITHSDSYQWVCMWPILDPDLTLRELRTEAESLIPQRLQLAGIAPVGKPEWALSDDSRSLLCSLPVRRIDEHEAAIHGIDEPLLWEETPECAAQQEMDRLRDCWRAWQRGCRHEALWDDVRDFNRRERQKHRQQLKAREKAQAAA